MKINTRKKDYLYLAYGVGVELNPGLSKAEMVNILEDFFNTMQNIYERGSEYEVKCALEHINYQGDPSVPPPNEREDIIRFVNDKKYYFNTLKKFDIHHKK